MGDGSEFSESKDFLHPTYDLPELCKICVPETQRIGVFQIQRGVGEVVEEEAAV